MMFLGALAVLIFVRAIACPRAIEYNVSISDQTVAEIASALDTTLMDVERLASAVSSKRVLLVGEVHFRVEIMSYFVEFLERMDSQKLVLALELPASVQPALDSYMESGDVKYLEMMEANEDCLPFSGIVSWCYKNRTRVVRVLAIDEDPWRIGLMRAICWDTRNQTMAEGIANAYREYPDAKIVAYGGQFHMLRGGRYMYDSASRIPCGARLSSFGIADTDVSSILLDGGDRFPLAPAWRGRIGAMDVSQMKGSLPITSLLGDTLFRATETKAVLQYFVNVGPVTKMSR